MVCRELRCKDNGAWDCFLNIWLNVVCLLIHLYKCLMVMDRVMQNEPVT